MEKKRNLARWLFLLPDLLGIAVFALFPMLEVLLGPFGLPLGAIGLACKIFKRY